MSTNSVPARRPFIQAHNPDQASVTPAARPKFDIWLVWGDPDGPTFEGAVCGGHADDLVAAKCVLYRVVGGCWDQVMKGEQSMEYYGDCRAQITDRSGNVIERITVIELAAA